MDVVQNQIDMALDLLRFAKGIQDTVWETELKRRLGVLSKRRSKLRGRRTSC
ncbi:hypothetical protein D3C86_2165170 [compost metagenome]